MNDLISAQAKTQLILIHDTNCVTRVHALRRAVEQVLCITQCVVVFANAEVFSIEDAPLQRDVQALQTYAQAHGVRWFCLAKGCVCCSAKLILQTHLARVLRFSQPDYLILELDSTAHLSTVLEWFKHEQWQPWLQTIRVFS